MPIDHRKSNWLLAGGCLCGNSYLFKCWDPICVLCSGMDVCLCLGTDCTCPSDSNSNVPPICTCIPFCTVYPKIGCCKSVSGDKGLYPKPEEQGKYGMKKNWVPFCTFCFPKLFATNCYFLKCYTCCAMEATYCCLSSDCAFPCSEDIPMTLGGMFIPSPIGPLGIPFLMCYPKCGCCLTVAKAMPAGKIAPAPADIPPVEAAAPPADAVAQGTVVSVQQPLQRAPQAGVVLVPTPFGAVPGSMLIIINPFTGMQMMVTVPPGVVPGQAFPVMMPGAVGAPPAAEAEDGVHIDGVPAKRCAKVVEPTVTAETIER